MSQSKINDVAMNQALDNINKLNDQEEVNETLLELFCLDQAVADFISALLSISS